MRVHTQFCLLTCSHRGDFELLPYFIRIRLKISWNTRDSPSHDRVRACDCEANPCGEIGWDAREACIARGTDRQHCTDRELYLSYVPYYSLFVSDLGPGVMLDIPYSPTPPR